MISSIVNSVDKGIQNNVVTTNKHNFWKTNFNMPVKNFFVDITNWIRYLGPVTHIGGATAFDLAGFSPGFEIVVFSTIWDYENNEGATKTINVFLYSKWVNTDNLTTLVQGANGISWTTDILNTNWVEYMYFVNIGCAGWEISTSANYYVKANATGNYPISEVSTTINFSNVPNTTQLANGKEGYIWVEGNNLCFVNANKWKHTIIGIDNGSAPGISKAGYIWLDTIVLHWVGGNGHDYFIPWTVKQFASSFSNGPTGATFAGISKYGMIWVDSEFGYTHLAYIANDGYKYLTGAGDNPYF